MEYTEWRTLSQGIPSSCTVRVERVSKVHPDKPSKEKRIVFLTCCDLVCRSYPYINRIFFFKHEEGVDEATQRLREGLGRALESFYPLAGKFCIDGEGRLQVECSATTGAAGEGAMAEGSGAEFVEAVCDMSYASLAEEGFQHHQVFWELARRTHRLRCDYLDEPILSVQVTRFKDNGGFSVGVSMSHVVGDAQSFYDFVKCWGELCRGLSMTSPPVHMRTALSVKSLFPSEVVFPSEAIHGAKITLEKQQQHMNNGDAQGKTHMNNGDTQGKPHSKESLSVGEDLDELVKGMGKMEMDLLKKEVGRSVKKYIQPTSTRTQAPIIEKQLEQEDHRRPRTDLVQKVFTFSVDSLQRLKQRVNSEHMKKEYAAMAEISSKASNDQAQVSKNGFFTTFEAFCAHWWQCFVRAKRLPASQSVFLLIPINCRQRYLDLPSTYFGNALDGALVKLKAGDLCGADLADIAAEIHDAIKAATEEGFKQYIKEAEVKRNEIPHFDRTGLFHVVDSPKYPIYEVDFGFGIPEAVRAEGFRFGAEVQILASRLGPGSYDIFCAHDAETMHRLEEDSAFLAL